MQSLASARTLFAGRGVGRTFAAAAATAELVRSGGYTAPAMRSGDKSSAAKEQVSWMRDPKTGDWVPENRVGEVDAAQLRELLLTKK